MTSSDLARIVAQANAIGRSRGLFCCYKMDGTQFAWVFYRRGPMGLIRLGKTTDAAQVLNRMTRYAEVPA